MTGRTRSNFTDQWQKVYTALLQEEQWERIQVTTLRRRCQYDPMQFLSGDWTYGGQATACRWKTGGRQPIVASKTEPTFAV